MRGFDRDPELPGGFQDADFEQRDLEAAGREHRRRVKRSRALIAAGDLSRAAEVCPHGGGYPLRSLAAEMDGDQRAGQEGWRCLDCYSVLDMAPVRTGPTRVLHACETRPVAR